MLVVIYPKFDNPNTEEVEYGDPVYVAQHRADTYDEEVAILKRDLNDVMYERGDSDFIAIAYEMADGATEYENSSYAVVAVEWDPIRQRWDYWHEEEIPNILPEEIIYW